MKSPIWGLIALALFLAGPSADAAIMQIEDVPGVSIQFTGSDFASLSINGVFQGQSFTGDFSEGQTLFFHGSFDAGSIATEIRTVYFVDAADPSSVSDVLSYVLNNVGQSFGVIDGSYQSETGALPLNVDPNDVVVGDGQPFQFGQPSAGIDATAMIDADTAAVPEPATFVMLVIGVASLAGYRRRGSMCCRRFTV